MNNFDKRSLRKLGPGEEPLISYTPSTEWVDDAGYIQMYSGRKLYPGERLAPIQDWQVSRLISMDDIAQSLSHQSRFNGHLTKTYTVAQHAVLMSEWPDPDGMTLSDRFICLHHDDTEAFVGDMPKPMKDGVPQFKAAEGLLYQYWVQPLLHMMVRHSPIPSQLTEPDGTFTMNLVVKTLDCAMIAWEQRDVFDTSTLRGSTKGWSYGYWGSNDAPKKRIRVWPMWWAKARFLARNVELLGLATRASYKGIQSRVLKDQISIPIIDRDELVFVDLYHGYSHENYNKALYFRELFGISWIRAYLITQLAKVTRVFGY